MSALPDHVIDLIDGGPPAGTDTDNGAAAEPPTLAMSVTEIDVSGLVIPRGPIAF